MGLTAGELEKLRDDHPHSITPYLSIHTPRTVFSGIVDGAHDKGAIDITVITFTGDLADVEVGMTVYVDQVGGTTMPRFKRRVRYVDVGLDRISVDENGISWNDSDVITVVENYELWSVFPRLVPDPDVPDAVIFYKDYNNPYFTQNSYSYPVAQIHGQRNVITDSVPIDLLLTGAGSYTTAPAATIGNYLWECPEATFTPSATVVAPTLSFDDYYPDGVWVKLTVTDNNLMSHYTRKLIFIHSRTGADAPHTDFTISSLSGDWDSGGWQATIKAHSDFADFVVEGSRAVLWHEAVFGKRTDESDLEDYLGSQTEILLDGIIVKEEPVYDGSGVLTTTLRIADIIQQMKERRAFSVSLSDVALPTKWYEYQSLTVTRAMHHLYMWHSTLFQIANVSLPIIANDFVSAVDDFTANTLYSIGDNFLRSYSIFAHVVANKMGDIHMEVEYNMLSDTDRAAVQLEMAVTEEDYAGEPLVKFTRNTFPRAWIVTASGTYYDGTTSTPLISSAPGEVPDALGHREVKVERLVFSDLDDAKVKSGRMYAITNARLERITLNMAGNYSFMDIVPQRRFELSFTQAQTGREAYEGYCIPRNISIGIDQAAGTVTQQVEFEPEAEAFMGVDVPIPEEPPASEPPPPDDPIIYPIPVAPGYGDGFGTVYAMVSTKLGRTRDLSASSPAWVDITPAAGTNYDWILDPWDPYAVGFLLSSAGVYRSMDLTAVTPTWDLIFDAASIISGLGLTTFANGYGKVVGSINIDGYLAVFWIGDANKLYCSTTSDNKAATPTWNHVLIGTTLTNYAALGWAGSADVVQHVIGSALTLFVAFTKTGGTGGNISISKSTDSGATWSTAGTLTSIASNKAPFALHTPFNGNEAAQIIFAQVYLDTPAYRGVWISTDGGVNWTQKYSGNQSFITRFGVESYTNDASTGYFIIGNVLYTTDDMFDAYTAAAMSGIAGTTILATGGFPTTDQQFYLVTNATAVGSGIYVSTDRGATWVNKTGDWRSVMGTASNAPISAARTVIVPLWLEE